MTSRSQPSKSDQASIKYQWVPLKVASFDHSGVGQQEDSSRLSGPRKQCSKESEPKSSDILSTAEFVSVVGHLWDSANQRLSVLQPKDVKQNASVNQKKNILYYSDEEKSKTTHSSDDRGYFCIDLKSSTGSPDTVCSKFEYISVSQKISLFKSSIRHDGHSFFRRYPHFEGSSVHVDLWKMNGMTSMGAPSDLRKIFGWTSRYPFLWFKYPGSLSLNKFKKPCEIIISESKRIPVNNLAMASNISDTSVTKSEDSSSLKTTYLIENARVSFTSPASDNFLRPVVSLGTANAVSQVQTSTLSSDYCIDPLALGSAATEERQYTPKADDIPDSSKKQLKEVHLEDGSTSELHSLISDKSNHVLAKQRHAFAGALAGTFVSLCIHPVDTIKTVIQSQSTAQKPIFDIVGSIISERGVTGLYRGIASNITSSAPISAIYTFTYESVKGALLPLLPKEYHSLAHCTAGGCASIATSFIFTPSERIKQQMQISSQYQNCWTALVGILKTGGFSSLYAGWSAVLCRNIPHSIIKFYTYESFKQLMLSPTQINAHPTTFQTLVCGGLAGSTAALFSTPFDVVKTRLQTEIPGSHRKYDGVFHALQEITKHEGLKGLYRGLTPRLIMYVSQGALFFASYECFKSVFQVEIPRLLGPTIQNRQHMKDEATASVLLPPSESESSSPTMPSLH